MYIYLFVIDILLIYYLFIYLSIHLFIYIFICVLLILFHLSLGVFCVLCRELHFRVRVTLLVSIIIIMHASAI